MHVVYTALLAALFAFGCAQPPAPAAPRHPTSPRSAERTLTFTPASGATQLDLPCTDVEGEIDNGLDDNCDGRIDKQVEPIAGHLFVALAHDAQVDLELSLTTGSGPTAQSSLTESARSRAHVCESTSPFAFQQAALSQLPIGHYEVAIAHGKACGSERPAAVNVSLWLDGKARGVFAVHVAPSARVVIGTVEVR